MILTPLQKLPNNVGDLGKIIVSTGFEGCPKWKILPKLVTLAEHDLMKVEMSFGNLRLSLLRYLVSRVMTF